MKKVTKKVALKVNNILKVIKENGFTSYDTDVELVQETIMSHEQIVEQYEAYLKEHEAFETKGVKAAATRARKALGELGKLTKTP